MGGRRGPGSRTWRLCRRGAGDGDVLPDAGPRPAGTPVAPGVPTGRIRRGGGDANPPRFWSRGWWRRWTSWWSPRRGEIPNVLCDGPVKRPADWRGNWASKAIRPAIRWWPNCWPRRITVCKPISKNREGSRHPDRNAQFEHISREVAAQIRGVSRRSRSTPRRRNWSGISRMAAENGSRRADPNRYGFMTSWTEARQGDPLWSV